MREAGCGAPTTHIAAACLDPLDEKEPAMAVLKLGTDNDPVLVRGALKLLSGNNVFRSRTYFGAVSGAFTAEAAAATREMKHRLGYPEDAVDGEFGDQLLHYLTGDERLPLAFRARRVARGFGKPRAKFVYPVQGTKGRNLGFPGQGTHSFQEAPNNWQSDNAIDIGIPEGTPLVAVADGTIGSRIGFISDDQAGRFAGQRFYLETADDEFFYHHCSKVLVSAGQKVTQGEVVAHSGVANGVPHLHLGRKNGDPADFFEL
jgi:murein DD-endopeptidase MepM/ murein hydrolase activator NlpD